MSLSIARVRCCSHLLRLHVRDEEREYEMEHVLLCCWMLLLLVVLLHGWV